MRNHLILSALAVLFGGSTVLAQGDERESDGQETPREPATFGQAIRGAEVSVGLRYRVEQSDDDAFDAGALASTLRTSLKLRTKPFRGFSFLLEAEDATAVGNDRLYRNLGHGDLDNGVRDRPAIADPELTVINQAAARLERGPVAFTLGRSELLIGDQRFVGAVGWRQHHQAFDTAALDAAVGADWSLRYAFLDRVHRITGAEEPMGSHVIHVSGPAGPGNLAVYGYLLDYERPAAAALSTSSWGASYAGSHDKGPTSVLFELQYAVQQDWADHPGSLDLDYQKTGIGFARGDLSLRAVREALDGDGTFGFRTPLATLHGFNGWTDKFLATPANGLVDVHVRLDHDLDTWNWTLRWHQFRSAVGSTDYGSEINAMAVWSAPWKQQIGIKLARYDADEFSQDTLKVWLWTSWNVSLRPADGR